MRVDFYQLTRDPPHIVLPAIAQNILKNQERLLVITNPESFTVISDALWAHKNDNFLAHDIASVSKDEYQPILLSSEFNAPNGAKMLAICNGLWNEKALEFERVFHMFNPDQIDDARILWRELMTKDGLELHYWKQDGRKWVEGPSRKPS